MYRQPSLSKKIAEILTWSLLILLIPLAVLGFLSEKSIPGQPLYPMKRTIENIVLASDAFDKKSQALYKVYLVDRRFFETQSLLTDGSIQLDTSQVRDFALQIDSAKDTINGVANPQDRLALRKTLIQNITDYKNQLAVLQNTNSNENSQTIPQQYHTQGDYNADVPPRINQSLNTWQQNTPEPTVYSVPPSSNQNQMQDQGQNLDIQLNSGTSDISQQLQVELQQQLAALQQQQQQEQQNLLLQHNSSGGITPFVIPTNVPVPTFTPTPTFLPTPTFTPIPPSPTPTPTHIPTQYPTPTASPTPTFYQTFTNQKDNGNGNGNANGHLQ